MNEVGRKGQRREPQRPRRDFAPEFKAEIVALCVQGDRSIGQVAKDFDLTETSVRAWVNAEVRGSADTAELSLTERDELAALRRENRRMREDIEILKRATAFFARETR